MAAQEANVEEKPKEFKFQIDPDAVKLAEWESRGRSLPPPRSQVSGLVLVAEWGWALHPDVSENYDELLRATAAVSDGSLYTYPKFATHVTVATLSSFRKPDAARANISAEVDAALISAWGDALVVAIDDSNESPFDLEAYRIEISPGAAFLHFKDPNGSIARLRSLVEKVRDHDPHLEALDRQLEGRVRSSVHIPDIVHTSFARFVKADHSGDGTGDDNLISKFDKMASKFAPFTIRIQKLTLADESTPYMHQDRVDGSIRTFSLQG